MQQPYFRPLTGAPVDSRQAQMHDATAAAEIASREEMAFMRSLGNPRRHKSELPQLKAPILSDDFEQRIEQLDDEIMSRGVAIDRDKLQSLGRQRFEQLLAADRKARSGTAVGDLTNWQSVQQALGAFEASSIKARTTHEQVSGSGKEREEVRRITGFDDLFKLTSERPEVINDIYAFRDAFESLCFGQSLLEGLSRDNRLRSRLFCGGRGRKVELLRDWLSVVRGCAKVDGRQLSLVSVRLEQPIFRLIAWLSKEQTPPPSLRDLCREWYGVRVPSETQIAIARAVVNGFVLDHREWQLWQHVGRATRTLINEELLSTWLFKLSKHYGAITTFFNELRAVFYTDVNQGDVRYAHSEFNLAAYRTWLDRVIQERLACASALLALGLDEVEKGAVVARFESQVLVDAKIKLADRRTQIARPLAVAFEGAFELQFEEVGA